jgi:hypothetical protein
VLGRKKQRDVVTLARLSMKHETFPTLKKLYDLETEIAKNEK